jgi:hypothetical protein
MRRFSDDARARTFFFVRRWPLQAREPQSLKFTYDEATRITADA